MRRLIRAEAPQSSAVELALAEESCRLLGMGSTGLFRPVSLVSDPAGMCQKRPLPALCAQDWECRGRGPSRTFGWRSR
ncbi:MAG: hypothetical protein K0R61_1934 [Microvirga sp.]|nr:hypothetical protein [Microvirga sp.]